MSTQSQPLAMDRKLAVVDSAGNRHDFRVRTALIRTQDGEHYRGLSEVFDEVGVPINQEPDGSYRNVVTDQVFYALPGDHLHRELFSNA